MANIKKVFSIADTAIKKISTAVIGDVKAIFTSLVDTDDAAGPTSTSIDGCELDGSVWIEYNDTVPGGGNFDSWAKVIDAGVEAIEADSSTASPTHYIKTVVSGRGNTYGNARFYFRFNGASFDAGISSVSAGTLKLYFGTVDNSPDADVNKWKAFKHNNISVGSLVTGSYEKDEGTDGWDPDISGDETTISTAAFASFPITGDLLAYLSTQAQAQADVAFMLVNKLDYGNTAPTGDNSVTLQFTEGTNDSKDPVLEYTYT